MEVVPEKLYGVITGDVVGSTKLEPNARARLLDVMHEASRQIRLHFRHDVPLEVEVFSGDSWQMLVADPGRVFRVGLFYRAYLLSEMNLRGFDTRMAIAVGTVDFVPGERVSEAEGPAFRGSGRLLQEMTTGGSAHARARVRFMGPDPSSADSLAWDACALLLDAIVQKNWSAGRARAITGALRSIKQETIGELWDPAIRQAGVAQHLRGAEWGAINGLLDRFETVWANRSSNG
ncbi:MAG TPA: hypothetical protein VGN72_09585 [Tepidisphaeraceae bacterium]|nr:hypothetical protein [Tepidisphaeraceae bacterium]